MRARGQAVWGRELCVRSRTSCEHKTATLFGCREGGGLVIYQTAHVLLLMFWLENLRVSRETAPEISEYLLRACYTQEWCQQ